MMTATYHTAADALVASNHATTVTGVLHMPIRLGLRSYTIMTVADRAAQIERAA